MPCAMNPSCVPFSGEISGSTAVIIPMPTNEIDAIVEGQGLSSMGDEIWPLIVIGIVSIPLGLEVFRRGERYAKKHGKLKRSG